MKDFITFRKDTNIQEQMGEILKSKSFHAVMLFGFTNIKDNPEPTFVISDDIENKDDFHAIQQIVMKKYVASLKKENT